jgi:hypothetical protein
MQPQEKQKQYYFESLTKSDLRVQLEERQEVFQQKHEEVDRPVDGPKGSRSFVLVLFLEKVVGPPCREEEGECEVCEAEYHI